MAERRIVAAVLLALSLVAVAARPSQDGLYQLEDFRRPIFRGNLRTRESKSDTDTEVIVRSGISVMNEGEDPRAVFVKPTSATPMGDSFKMVTNQLLQAPTATDMVATDVRTPPRVKSQHRKEDIPVVGKGEATPIEIDDKNMFEPSSTTQKVSTSPSSEGISTWILLSSGEQSTLATSKKKTPPPTSTAVPEKKYSATISTTTDKVKAEKPIQTNKVSSIPAKKQNVTKDEHQKTPVITLHDSKFKNRTPIIVGRVPSTQKNKTDLPSTKKPTTHLPTSSSEISTTKKKLPTTTPTTTVSLTSVKGTFLPEVVPTTSLVVETDTIESTDDSVTTETPSTTTKRTRRPGTKKKKKNKNRRRRPTKTDSTQLESKISPENSVNNNSKIEGNPNRPLSTRIYNYLAREVMPNVGVGIVGLVLTAGLAGLLLYPFGGGIARRNDYKVSGPTPDGHMYYYNDYSPNSDVDHGNVQSEETVFGQVLSGMKHNSYSNSYESPQYNNKYRYETQDYNGGVVNGYAGVGEYSTIPESIKNSDYSTLPESTKYYSMDHISPQYKTSETSLELDKYNDDDSKYPSLTEYSAYTDAESVGTNGKYDSSQQETKTDISEDKSDKSQPQFSPLVGSPQFNDFVGSVSVSGSYGTEVHHRTGAMASEHGPRSLKLNKREKRDLVHSNEIDVGSINSQDTKAALQMQTTNEGATTLHEMETSTMKATEQTYIETTSATTTVTEKEKEVTTPCPEVTTMKNKTEEFSFIELLRSLAQAKLKLGINLLRVTSDTFQKYLDSLTMKMETAVKHLDKKPSNTTMAPPPARVMKRRNKREVKKQHKKKYNPSKYKKE